MFKILFLAIGTGMAAGGAWTVARPLWKEGYPVLAALVGLFILTLTGGLLYFLGFAG